MIIATISVLMLLFGGGDSLENYLLNIKKPVKAAVESKVTVNEVLDLSKVLKKRLKAQNKEITELRENFLNLHKQYDTKPADSEAYIDRLIIVRETGQKHILDTRSAIVHQILSEFLREA